jgi:hypothetical protein
MVEKLGFFLLLIYTHTTHIYMCVFHCVDHYILFLSIACSIIFRFVFWLIEKWLLEWWNGETYTYTYTYIYIRACMCTCIYIYVYILFVFHCLLRIDDCWISLRCWILIVVKRKWRNIHIYTRHIYIYVCIYMCVYMCVCLMIDCLIVWSILVLVDWDCELDGCGNKLDIYLHTYTRHFCVCMYTRVYVYGYVLM